MRRRRRPPSFTGVLIIALGVLVLLALVLPSEFWWFALGVGLIALGCCWSRRC